MDACVRLKLCRVNHSTSATCDAWSCNMVYLTVPLPCILMKIHAMPRSTNHHRQNSISKDIDMWCVHAWNKLVITLAAWPHMGKMARVWG